MTKIFGIQWSEILAFLTVIGIPLGIIWGKRGSIIKWFKRIYKKIKTRYTNIKAEIRKRWEKFVGIEEKDKEIEYLKKKCEELEATNEKLDSELKYIKSRNIIIL